MTIIAGFKGYDGIVLCADTQETIAHSKRNVPKLRFESTDTGTSIAVAFCGAGDNGPFIDKLVENAWKEAARAQSLDSLCERIENSIKNTYSEFGQIYQPGYCPAAELIYGVKINDESRMFHALGPVVNEKSSSTAGAGQPLADFLTMRMYKNYLSVRQLIILAAYVLFQTKENVEGCGGESHIAVLRNDGASGRVDPKHIHELTQLVTYADNDLSEALLSCANLELKTGELRKTFKLILSTIETFRKNASIEIKQYRKMGGLMSYFAPLTDELGIQIKRKPKRIRRSISRK